jgi:drug/metabolite transporter (DMT)-like permease
MGTQIKDRTRPAGKSPRAFVFMAFAAVYVIWGSTYLAIRYAIQTLPPFLMSGTRFLVAGAILFTWSKLKGQRTSLSEWRKALLIGALLLLFGNGGVTWSEKYVASGLAALLVALEPLWVVMLNWAITRRRPSVKVLLGVLIGLAGVSLLVSGQFATGPSGSVMALVATGVILLAGLAWAGGSVFVNRHPVKVSTTMASGMQMLSGGGLLFLAGLTTGEVRQLHLDQASWSSIGALLYLIIFGSLVAFTAYSWLLKNVNPSQAATYAYVNPVVAVFLGWLIASEPLTLTTIVAAAIVIGSVVLITTYGEGKNADKGAVDD